MSDASCPTDEELLALAEGHGSVPEALTTHLSQCDSCRRVVAMAARLATGSSPTPPAGAEAGAADVLPEQPGRYLAAGGRLELGRGGLGKVLLRRDRALGREVAVKELVRGGADVEQRFAREARLTGQLEHPGIVPVYDFGRRADGTLFYVMRRIEGRTLARAFAETRDPPDRLRLVTHFLSLCQTVAYAHSRGVIHRDIKPANVMLGPFGETLLVDWGLARTRGEASPASAPTDSNEPLLTAEGAVMGTPAYMPPEQARGEPADERTDLWALGAILYELLTGRATFPGASAVSVLALARAGRVEPIRQLAPAAPAELVAIAEKCLAPERGDRYASAAELVRDVEAWLGGRRVSAHDYGALELLVRFVRAWRAPLAVASVAAVLLVALAVRGVQQVRTERDEARAFAQLVIEDVGTNLKLAPGSEPFLQRLTARALEHYRRTVDLRTGPPDERRRLAVAWNRLGELSLGASQLDEAWKSFAFAQEIAERLVQERGEVPEDLRVLADTLTNESDVATERADFDASRALLDRALALLDKGLAAKPDALDALSLKSAVLNRRGNLEVTAGDRAGAVPWLERSAAIDRQLLEREPGNDDRAFNLGFSYMSIALAEVYLKDYQRADELLVASRSTLEALLERSPGRVVARQALAQLHATRAMLRFRQQRRVEGLAELHAALRRLDELADTDREDARFRMLELECAAAAGETKRALEAARWLDARPGAGGEAYAAMGYLQAGELEAAEKVALRAGGENKTAGLVYAAVAAALSGRAHDAAGYAREAAKQPGELTIPWSIPVPPKPAAPGTQAGAAATAFMEAFSAAYEQGDAAGMRGALETLAERLTAADAR